MAKRNAKAFEVSGDQDPRWKTAGAYFLVPYEGKTYVHFSCPCCCGEYGVIMDGADGWTLTPSPIGLTARPSIGFRKSKSTGQYHWHGYLTNGVFEEC